MSPEHADLIQERANTHAKAIKEATRLDTLLHLTMVYREGRITESSEQYAALCSQGHTSFGLDGSSRGFADGCFAGLNAIRNIVDLYRVCESCMTCRRFVWGKDRGEWGKCSLTGLPVHHPTVALDGCYGWLED